MTSHQFRRLLVVFWVLFGIQTNLHGQERLQLGVLSVSLKGRNSTALLLNSGRETITAYNITVTTRFANNTSATAETMTDFTSATASGVNLPSGLGPLLPGETREISVMPIEKAGTEAVGLVVNIDAVVLENRTFAGANKNALRLISEHRSMIVNQLTEWVGALQDVLAGEEVESKHQRDKLIGSAKALSLRHKRAAPGYEDDVARILATAGSKQPPSGRTRIDVHATPTDRLRTYVAIKRKQLDAYRRSVFEVK